MSARKKVVGFELTYEEIEKLNEISKKTGLKKVELLRQRLLEQDTLAKKFDALQTNLEAKIERKFEEEASNNLQILKFEIKNIEQKLSENIERIYKNFSEKMLAHVEEMSKRTLESTYKMFEEIAK